MLRTIQEEALTMSDRVIIVKDGRIESRTTCPQPSTNFPEPVCRRLLLSENNFFDIEGDEDHVAM